MTIVSVIKCDGCNREFRDQPHNWAPDGGYIVEGVYGSGEPYDRYHFCSASCLENWARRAQQRVIS